MPPAEPRDFGLALMPLALWLFLRAVRRRSPATGLAAGAVLGFVLLLSPIAAAVAAGCALVLSIRASVRVVAAGVAGAGIVAGMWLLPLAWHSHELGGFVNTTRAEPKSIGASAALVTLAMVVVLAALGAASRAIRQGEVDRRTIGVLVAVPVVIYAASSLLSGGGAIPAVSRSVRYLPPVGLMLVFPAALGAVVAVRAAGRAAPYAAVLLGALCIASPVAAAVGMSRAVAWTEGHPVVACDPSPPLGAGDTVAVVPVPARGGMPPRPSDSRSSPPPAPTSSTSRGPASGTGTSSSTSSHSATESSRRSRSGKGAAPSGDVTAVMAPAGAAVATNGLVRAASCHVHAYALGRFYDADYTLYRVVP